MLSHFDNNLHNKDNRPLGSRKLLERLMLVADLICRIQPKPADIASLVAWSEAGTGATEIDLQDELTRSYNKLREEFSPLAFLYDLRTHGGLAHPPNIKAAAEAAKRLGLPEKGWRRADFLKLLSRVRNAIASVAEPIKRAAQVQ